MSTIEKGTYKWVDNPDFSTLKVGGSSTGYEYFSINLIFTFSPVTEYNLTLYKFNKMKMNRNKELYYYIDGAGYLAGKVVDNKFVWEDTKYKTISVLELFDATLGDAKKFYNWAITEGNLIKQEESTKTLKTLKVNGKGLLKVNDKYLKNLNDSPIFAAKKAEVVSAGETWLINENPDITVETFLNTTITGKVNPLTANETYGESVKMYMIGVQQGNMFIAGISPEGFGGVGYTDNDKTWKFFTLDDQSYTITDTTKLRTITFDTAPTGELLTWLQANAVKQ